MNNMMQSCEHEFGIAVKRCKWISCCVPSNRSFNQMLSSTAIFMKNWPLRFSLSTYSMCSRRCKLHPLQTAHQIRRAQCLELHVSASTMSLFSWIEQRSVYMRWDWECAEYISLPTVYQECLLFRNAVF